MNQAPRILFCPLDWGLGHATRSIPLIEELQRQGAIVLIAASGRTLTLLMEAFPKNEHVDFPGFEVRYPKSNLALAMVLQLPKLFYAIYKEHRKLDLLIAEHRIDAVISDNRFGLFTNRIPCIFMTHQIFIKAAKGLKFTKNLLFRINIAFIHKYSACWVPDFPTEDNLSGDLAHLNELPEKTVFIGPLSRFTRDLNKIEQTDKRWDLLVLLSGPEPQRSLFENKILSQLKDTLMKVLIVRGMPGDPLISLANKNITITNHLSTNDMQAALVIADLVLCRPGYSSIMDLALLNKRAIFVPTPGQTEQEYLATYYSEKGYCSFQSQDQFNLNLLMLQSRADKGLSMPIGPDLLKNIVRNFLLQIPKIKAVH